MRRALCVVLLNLFLISAAACNTAGSTQYQKVENEYIKGVWISFSELDGWCLSGNFKSKFSNAVNECKKRQITDVFVHIRPFCDSYYPSQYFPTRQSAENLDFDVLEYMINECHSRNINFHAWINPYRISTQKTKVSELSKNSPAAKWLSDTTPQNDTAVAFFEGIYLNPASVTAQQLVIDGIREIVLNYDVDGIHFDDYFYPTTSEEFDSALYGEYTLQTEKPMSLADWRRANVNALISGVYTAVKFADKDIIFSVSPSASIEENYEKLYADVALWCKSGCVDYIIPQLYFGFSYPDTQYRFENLLSRWKALKSESDTKLLIGLASYKINTDQQPDSEEWSNGIDVIKRQQEICENQKDISGQVLFSYTSMKEYL